MPSRRFSAALADVLAVRAALRAVVLADARVVLALARAALPWRDAVLFLAVARRWTWVWLLRALVLRARELVVRLRDVPERVPVERVLLERLLVLRVELLRRLFWLVAIVVVLLLGGVSLS
jgi:hypothetical protein